jgi:acyl dehydratase
MATRTGPTDFAAAPTGRAQIDAIQVGDAARCEARIDEPQIAAFAALSGDTNPLHLSSSVANEYGFERPVAHGLLALSMISRLIGTALPGPGSLWVGQNVRFSSPVLAGDSLIAEVTVVQVSRATGLVALRTDVRNAATGATVLSGEARVRVGAARSADAGVEVAE